MLPRVLLFALGILMLAPVATADPLVHHSVNALVACIDPGIRIVVGPAATAAAATGFPPDVPDACNPDPCMVVPDGVAIMTCKEIKDLINP